MLYKLLRIIFIVFERTLLVGIPLLKSTTSSNEAYEELDDIWVVWPVEAPL